jgi:hypothetical protein
MGVRHYRWGYKDYQWAFGIIAGNMRIIYRRLTMIVGHMRIIDGRSALPLEI